MLFSAVAARRHSSKFFRQPTHVGLGKKSGVLAGDVVDLDSAPGKLAPTVILSVVIKAGRISDPKRA